MIPRINFKGDWIKPLGVVLLAVLVIAMLGSFVYRMWVKPPVDAARTELPQNAAYAIQLNILNGTSGQGMARTAMDYLRNRGFDVVDIGNHPEIIARSYVIDYTGDSVSAARVAYAMGISPARIKTDRDSNLCLQCGVVIGNDYPSLKPFQ
ncbi:MAG: LytR C-terminal domain-containing protein [Candidatus Kapabacteria bacterium]|nr:LytR C-terminal domain-containing protein [Candidatus Kapabacteria bacterium]